MAARKGRDPTRVSWQITDGIRVHPEFDVFEKTVTQSSDAEFLCLAITLVYWFDGSRITAR